MVWTQKLDEFVSSSTGHRIALSCAMGAIFVSMITVGGHLYYYTRPTLQRSVVRVVFIVPVYAAGSALSLIAPSAAVYFDSIRDCYESFVIYTFMSLMIAYGGGEAATILAIEENPGFVKHPVPCCCLPVMITNSKFVRLCKQQVLIFVVVKLFNAAASLLAQWLGKLNSSTFILFQLVIYNISYTSALYFLLMYYQATKVHLAQYKTVQKFVATKLIIFATYWQSLLVEIVPGLTREQALRTNDFILSVEMLLFAFAHMYAFTFKAFMVLPGPRGSFFKNMWHVMSLKDVAQDTVNAFSKRFSRYMLASTFNIDATENLPPSAAVPGKDVEMGAVGATAAATGGSGAAAAGEGAADPANSSGADLIVPPPKEGSEDSLF